MPKPSIVILGAGGVGGYFGARLVEHDAADVKFLVREARKSVLMRDGLSVKSPHGNIERMPVAAFTAAELAGAYPDYLLLTCKAYDLNAAMETISPVVGPNTAIVPLLNGLVHIERLNQRFSRAQILPGSVSLQVRQNPDSTIEHLNAWQFFTVGEQDSGITERVSRLVSALERAMTTPSASADIMQKMWEKIVMLASLAAMTTLMRAPVGTIASAPGGAELSRRMLELNAAAAAHAGHPVPASLLDQWRTMFSDTGSTFAASMLGDMERGGPVEADHIVGDMLERVRAAGLDTTLHAIAYANLKVYEARRKAS